MSQSEKPFLEIDVCHPAFVKPESGVSPEEARLTDRDRLALVLQGAAVLAHLDHAGLFPDRVLDDARVDEAGLLHLDKPVETHHAELPQVLLLRLLRRLFRVSDEKLAGRGEARRAARHLMGRWRQTLVPSSPDRAVADILASAPFLWRPDFGAARRALVAEHRRGERSHLWVAGPGPHRRRILARGDDRATLEELLASPEAMDVWEGFDPDTAPEMLIEVGAWRRAAAIFRRSPPETPDGVLIHARCLFSLGLFSQAFETLKGQEGFEAELLRLRCQLELGEVRGAQGTLRRLEALDLDADETIGLAGTAVHLLSRGGDHAASRDWVARAHRAARRSPRRRLCAELVAAEAAWDRGDHEATSRHLEAARPALEDPELAERWHRARVLLGMARGDGLAVTEHAAASLKNRRGLTPVDAGRRWSDLAYGRVLLGDLAGAERAMRHSLRLLGDSESPSRHTLALTNLAEIKLRRGRPDGVAAALDLSTAENRRSGNMPGLLGDLELWVRLELVHGRPAAALALVAEALELVAESGVESRRDVFDLLAARAHGWLGRPQVAAERLDRITPETFHELEPEEVPALWALAGRAEAAAEAAVGTPWEGLWAAHIAELEPDADAWNALQKLEPYRAARLVFDFETVHSGAVPSSWIRRAVIGLRRVGAETFAERLDGGALLAWRALGRYLEPGSTDPATADAADRRDAAAELLRAAGYGDARLLHRRRGRETAWIPGAGGAEDLRLVRGEDELIVEAPVIDPVLHTLALLLRRDMPSPQVSEGLEKKRSMPAGDGILGRSDSLGKSIDRLDRLAKGRLPVLILGESGTGKELAARRVHRLSPRAAEPFLAVNCAALSESLIQSELFGHVRGAFTGADRDRAGLFESARGGTVFLDEIGDLPLAEQGKLLRVLQEGEVRRVGESFARKVDVRIVTATHRNLEGMVGVRTFREDLFFRLRVARILLPPLREREGDVMYLAEHFLRQAVNEAGGDAEAASISAAARGVLLGHAWPGNIRELKNVLEVAAALADEGEILPEHLELQGAGTESPPPKGTYHEIVDAHRRQLLIKILRESNGNRAEAARRYGLSRQALSYLVRRLEIDEDDLKKSDE